MKIRFLHAWRLALVGVLFCQTVLSAGRPGALYEASAYESPATRPRFSWGTYTFAVPGRKDCRVLVFADFVNDLLQFHRTADGFRARYEVVADLVDANGERLDGFVESGEVTTRVFEETNSRRRVNRCRLEFNVPPGRYEILLELTDAFTQRRLFRRKPLEVTGLAGALAISDLMVVDTLEFGSHHLPDSPNLGLTYDDPASEFAAYFEIYAGREDSIYMNYRIYDDAGLGFINIQETMLPRDGVARKLVPLKNLISLPGHYLLVVEARMNDVKVARRTSFLIQYWDQPGNDAEEAGALLAAMKYVMDVAAYQRLVVADAARREALIDSFWADRDPTPGSAGNELREEFQERVRYALENFSNVTAHRGGVETDRGATYIVFGPPSETSKTTLPSSARTYEFWYYRELDKRFIFLDKTGSGVYRLIHKE